MFHSISFILCQKRKLDKLDRLGFDVNTKSVFCSVASNQTRKSLGNSINVDYFNHLDHQFVDVRDIHYLAPR